MTTNTTTASALIPTGVRFPALPAPSRFDRETRRELHHRSGTEYVHEVDLAWWNELVASRLSTVHVATEAASYAPVADLVHGSTPTPVVEVPAPRPQPRTPLGDDITAVYAWLKAYTGASSFLLSLQAQLRRTHRLSDKQVAAARRNMEAATSAPQAPAAAPQAAPQAPAPVDFSRVTEGMWTTPDGAIYKVLPSRNGGGRHYAKVLVDGHFGYAQGAMVKLAREGSRMSLDAAKGYGRLTGRCAYCARLLTDPASIEAGVGPVCMARWG